MTIRTCDICGREAPESGYEVTLYMGRPRVLDARGTAIVTDKYDLCPDCGRRLEQALLDMKRQAQEGETQHD